MFNAHRHLYHPTLGLGVVKKKRRYEARCKATWKRKVRLPWRETGPPNHRDDEVDSDQQVVNVELSVSMTLERMAGARGSGTSTRSSQQRMPTAVPRS